MNTFEMAVSYKNQKGEVVVTLQPGRIIDGALIVEVRDTGRDIEAITEHGDPVLFLYEATATVAEPFNHHPDGLGKWTGCPSCYRGGFGPSHKASRGCKSGSRAHCTCDACF